MTDPSDECVKLGRKLAPCPHCVMDVVGTGRVDTELGVIKCPMCNGTGADPEALEALRKFAFAVWADGATRGVADGFAGLPNRTRNPYEKTPDNAR